MFWLILFNHSRCIAIILSLASLPLSNHSLIVPSIAIHRTIIASEIHKANIHGTTIQQLTIHQATSHTLRPIRPHHLQIISLLFKLKVKATADCIQCLPLRHTIRINMFTISINFMLENITYDNYKIAINKFGKLAIRKEFKEFQLL